MSAEFRARYYATLLCVTLVGMNYLGYRTHHDFKNYTQQTTNIIQALAKRNRELMEETGKKYQVINEMRRQQRYDVSKDLLEPVEDRFGGGKE
ncbi:hypothetical protein HII31_07030 [Pseudocercospora fuligena]|uniref:Uncharacterized protein n=1 Tax=Pseudocercospora fuligena TaxID=685502 RepID=A0A8H6RII4_9PEZI|nr:hypothetical protein HII31_07030 [Pseudocercospora fuligena]